MWLRIDPQTRSWRSYKLVAGSNGHRSNEATQPARFEDGPKYRSLTKGCVDAVSLDPGTDQVGSFALFCADQTHSVARANRFNRL